MIMTGKFASNVVIRGNESREGSDESAHLRRFILLTSR